MTVHWGGRGPGHMSRNSAPSFTPLSLFSAGEQGFWYDPSDISTLFQDAAGTTPVTAAGQSVGLVLDKSGRGNHATQSTSLSRPIYGIEPFGGRRNLLTYTEQFDNAAWSKLNSSVTNNAATDPSGTTAADLLVANTTNAQHRLDYGTTIAAATYSFSVYAKAGGYNFIYIRIGVNGGYVDLTNGSVVSSVPAGYTLTVSPAGNGWYRIVLTGAAVLNDIVRINVCQNVSSDFSGNGTSGIFIWGAQLEAGSAATAYQCVTDQWNVTEAGKASVSYLAFDGSDDFLVTPTITPGTDKAQVFAGVRKLSDAATGVVAELSATLNLNNGTLLLAAPVVAGTPDYSFSSKGTTGASQTRGGFASPRTDVLTALADISGPSVQLRVSSNVVAAGTGGQGTGNYLAYPAYIGRRGGTALPFNGRIYSLICRFGPNLTADQIAQTETWVNARTGAY